MAAIQVDNLSYAYPGSQPVLRGLNFSVEDGETLAIIGLSGCGKTTLCKCLCGMVPHVLSGSLVGQVLIKGKHTTDYKLPQLACEIGMVMQDPDLQLVTTTVEDEIAFAPENICLPPAEINRRVDEIIKLLGFSHLRLKNPGILSGGQKQLLSLGAVLALEPSILVLDEPLARLDQKGRQLVREILLNLRSRGKTLIIVEHDLENVDFADRFLLMEEGRMICLDTPTAVMAKRDFLKQHRLCF